MERGAVLSAMKIVILRFLVLIALLIGLQLLRRHFEPFVLQANDNIFGSGTARSLPFAGGRLRAVQLLRQ